MHISPVLWQFLTKWLTDSPIFPQEASTIAPWEDALYFFLIGMTLTGLVLVGALVFGFAVRYRQSRSPVATQIEGSTLLEATWTIIPLAIFLVTFVWGAQLTMISQDVFHSFSVPAFRVKREVIPGRYTTVWFQATKPGTYHLFCTQYCGTKHSGMIGEITVLTPEDYERWTRESTSGMSLAQNGEKLFASMGCTACHNGTAAARGPSLAGVYGSRLTLANGSQVSVNEAYLRDSILNPSEHVTAGYAPIMPTYQGQISEDGLIDLIEYIKTLNSNYRPQQTSGTSQSDLAAPTASGMEK